MANLTTAQADIINRMNPDAQKCALGSSIKGTQDSLGSTQTYLETVNEVEAVASPGTAASTEIIYTDLTVAAGVTGVATLADAATAGVFKMFVTTANGTTGTISLTYNAAGSLNLSTVGDFAFMVFDGDEWRVIASQTT